MISYLLGELTEEEQTDFELRYFSSPDLLDELSAVEDDLIDEYVRGELTRHQATRIESHLSSSEELRQRVASARALAQIVPQLKNSSATNQTVAVAPEEEKSGWLERSLSFLRAPFTTRKLSFTLGLLALVLVGAWLIFRTLRPPVEVARRQNEEETGRTPTQQSPDNQNRPGETATPSPTNERQQNADENRGAGHDKTQPEGNQVPATPRTTPTRGETFVAVISPGALRGESGVRKLTVPETASLLRMRLELDSPDEGYKSYRAEMSADNLGRNVLSRSGMLARGETGRKYLTLDVPLKSLVTGDYTLRLEGQGGDGNFEKIEVYHLSILKK